MRLQHIIEQVYTRPWAITPAGWESVHNIIQSKLRGDVAEFRVEEGDSTDLFGEELPSFTIQDGFGIIPVKGTIARKIGMVGKMCGGCDLVDVEEQFLEAMADPDVHSVILDIDSPGGSVAGVPELASKIGAMRDTKPIFAFTDGMMCSAAYWLGSQAHAIVATPTAEVGSIGVYMALLDYTRAMEMEGLKLELFKAGALKAMGLPGTSLTEDMREHLQAQVDTIYAWFTGAVTSGRSGFVDHGTMQGQSFMGDEAKNRNLVDHVAPDWMSALEKFKDILK